MTKKGETFCKLHLSPMCKKTALRAYRNKCTDKGILWYCLGTGKQSLCTTETLAVEDGNVEIRKCQKLWLSFNCTDLFTRYQHFKMTPLY